MIKVKLCAFSDEASSALDGQIAALKRNNIPYMEMRTVNGKNVTTLTVDEAKEILLEWIENYEELCEKHGWRND